ncbi:deoxyribodipyrimidine photo-lyase [uncultured Eudoraea sp.]|uniref:cryptochrome/photolyase family protein n=1 Tax=uncultured Eudoraea sp. TaxID=1035614 RepID=UPI002601D4B8|nr:deoxyribodipyrimidine photo-lyase [uncultured Eudoraea sp.]
MPQKISIFWFRRDLRLHDNVGLYHALKGNHPVLPIFIFDTEILQSLPENDARVSFIYDSLQEIRKQLTEHYQSSIGIYFGNPLDIIKTLIAEYDVQSVYTNRDYEPYARKRDREIAQTLKLSNIEFKTFKDQVIFEKNEVVKDNGEPYVVYTPYMRKWKQKFHLDEPVMLYDSESLLNRMHKKTDLPNLALEEIGFNRSDIKVPAYEISKSLLNSYEKTRNFPAIEKGTSKLGPHLRFGTVSTRQIVLKAMNIKNETFLNELIWREFFMQILWHFPHTVHKAFKPKYDRIPWRNNESDFDKWKNGETGYPLVDAGMRELNSTGFMHNRVRMLVASFLCKHLLIDWRWGEAYFALKLLDFELSSNVGNWQWAAGSGVDAAPYFRIFNPITQVDKFDKQKEYINKWVPELQELTYPQMMVDHKMARERCLKTYKEALN